MHRLANIEAFVTSAELGNFTLAARRLALTPSALSRRISQLEAQLGVRLFHRSTRVVRLSDEGRAFFERARAALRELEEAEQALAGQRQRPTGLLRVEAPTILGRHVVVPAVAKLVARHADVRIELTLRDYASDLVSEGIDVGLRLGPLTDSTLIARRLGQTKMRVCGAPSYLRRKGIPRSVAALERHDCLGFSLQGRALPWRLRDGDEPRDVVAGHRIVVTSAEALIDLAVAGAGLAWVCDFMMAQATARGELVEVLADAACDESPVHLVSQPARHVLPKVRVFSSYVAAQLGKRG
jgi:DNA-binding transcriptional LysR family regulator